MAARHRRRRPRGGGHVTTGEARVLLGSAEPLRPRWFWTAVASSAVLIVVGLMLVVRGWMAAVTVAARTPTPSATLLVAPAIVLTPAEGRAATRITVAGQGW